MAIRTPVAPEDIYTLYTEGEEVEFAIYYNTTTDRLTEIYYKNLTSSVVRVRVVRDPVNDPTNDIQRDLPANQTARSFTPPADVAPSLTGVVSVNVEHPPLSGTSTREA